MSTNGTPLDTLFGENKITLASGKEVAIKKVSMRNLKPVLNVVYAILDTLKVEGGVTTANLSDPKFILQSISNNLDAVYSLAVLQSSITEEELLNLEVDEGVAIISAIVKLNVDFFTTKVQPQLTALVAPPVAS